MRDTVKEKVQELALTLGPSAIQVFGSRRGVNRTGMRKRSRIVRRRSGATSVSCSASTMRRSSFAGTGDGAGDPGQTLVRLTLPEVTLGQDDDLVRYPPPLARELGSRSDRAVGSRGIARCQGYLLVLFRTR